MNTLLAYLQLLRLPAVFTAMADIFLGFLLTHSSLEPLTSFALLLVASSCLYLSGMVLNDVFDRQIDAQQRPDRPIPSGRVPLGRAVTLGLLLLAAGVGAAALAGYRALLVGGCLVLTILAYDGLLKATLLGPVAMGTCRFLNVMLGASAAGAVWEGPLLPVAAGLGVYVAGVTWFAGTEAQRSRRMQLGGAAGVVNLGLTAVALAMVTWRGETSPVQLAGVEWVRGLVPLVLIAVTLNRRMLAALVTPSANNVQASVRLSLQSLVLLDATWVFHASGSAAYALATVGLLLPTVWLGRWIPIT